MPGSLRSSASLSGNLPPCSATTARAQACRFLRARVIAEAGPGGEHLAELGPRQRRHVRPAAKKDGIARQHRLDRGLLQHDLAEPDLVRVWPLARRGAPRYPERQY